MEESKYLILYDKGIKKLPKLPETLEVLDVSNNQLKKLPKLPETLEVLDVSNNQLRKLPKLPKSLISLNVSNNQLEKLPNLKKRSFSLYLRIENNPVSKNLYDVKKLNNISKKFLNNDEYYTITLKKGTVLFHNMNKLNQIFDMYIGNIENDICSVSPDHQTYFFLHPFNLTYGDITTINILTRDVELLYLLEPSKIMKYNNQKFISRDNCKKSKNFSCISSNIIKNNVLGWLGHDTADEKNGGMWNGENNFFYKYYSYVSYYKNFNNVIDRPEIALYPFPNVSDDYVYFKVEDVFGIKENGNYWLEKNQNLFNYKTIAIIENSENFKEYKKVIDKLLSEEGLDGYRMKRNKEDGLYYVL
jgi:hypothetical protein